MSLYILPTTFVVKQLFEDLKVYPYEWGVNPVDTIKFVIDNLNYNDPANIETIVRKYMGELSDRVTAYNLTIPADIAYTLTDDVINKLGNVLIKLVYCLYEIYMVNGFWQNGFYQKAVFHNFIGYDIIIRIE